MKQEGRSYFARLRALGLAGYGFAFMGYTTINHG